MAVDAMWYFGSAIGSHHVQKASAKNVKRTLVSYGVERDWFDADQGSGVEFLHESTQVFSFFFFGFHFLFSQFLRHL